MERNILSTLEYDVNAPVAYRFLRRLARVCEYMHVTTSEHVCSS